ncbi:MAG TPA: Glu/Leu/Phe/Val dehydrogenase dimerization domain-containing protein [Solirubrobacterales bacterium]|nr:Glu/Leu/Phe/Val dehydrogenase dimerization domain-containing protein [Solirubrobacterales bacterium]
MRLYTYRDSEEDFSGFLAYSETTRPLAAGGMRVHPGLTGRRIEALARTMQYKESVLRVNVDGAKCGIAYDPTAPGKKEAVRRFLRFLAPHLSERLSLGPDMGTSFDEIEAIAREEGIASVKAAIGRAQGLSSDQVRRRLDLLEANVGQLTLGERRAGHGVAHSALAAVRVSGLEDDFLTCALQGFGTLGRGAALTLDAAGVAITTIADEHECVRAEEGLPVASMLRSPPGSPLREIALGAEVLPREAVLSTNSHMLVLAACENAFGDSSVEVARAPVVVVGANEGLSPQEYRRLAARGVLTVPDIVAGCGGSAAMDALFAPTCVPAPLTVLETVADTMSALTIRLLAETRSETTPLEAALRMAGRRDLPLDAKPYGLRLLAAGNRERRLVATNSADA